MRRRRRRLGAMAALALGFFLPLQTPAQFGVGPDGRLGLGGPASLPAASSRLASAAQQLIPTIHSELAGSSLGRQLEIRANALASAAQSLDDQVQRGAAPGILMGALSGVDSASQQIQSLMNSSPGAAPQSEMLAGQIGSLADSIRSMAGGVSPTGPIGADDGRPEYDLGTVIQQAEACRDDASRLASAIATQTGGGAYDPAVRDLQSLAAQLGTLRDQARRQNSLTVLQAGWGTISTRSAGISQSLRAASLPGSVANGLTALEADLDGLARVLQVSNSYVANPGQPALIDPPAYSGIPYQVVPTSVNRPYPTTLPSIDQALGQIDAFLLGIRPNIGTIPEGPRFQSDAVALRNDLLNLRQQTLNSGVMPPDALARLDRSYRRLASRTGRIAQGRYGPNIARIDTLGPIIGQILQGGTDQSY